MRSLKSGLVTLGVTSLLITAAVVGCSADGGTGIVTEAAPTDPTGGTAQLPAPSNNDDDDDTPTDTADGGKKDSGTKDSGPKADSSVDAGPPPPVPGTPCTTDSEQREKECGACGKQKTVCLDTGSGLKWQEYGVCENELPGGCIPGSTVTESCGNCGKQTKTCTKYCAYTVSACTGQPVNSCTPGGVELSTAGCTVADTYRQRSCKETCTWDSFSTTCSPPPTFLAVPPTVGQANSSLITLSATQTVARLSGSCPNGSINTSITPYNYFEIRNTTAKTATVSIYHSQATGGPILDTVIAAYTGATPPSTDAERKACLKGVGDFGTTALTGDGSFASLTNTSAVVIPPGGSVTVYSAQYYAYNAADAEAAGGKIKINVKTDKLE